MYVLITTRLVKINTGSHEKFAPRTTNQTRLTVSGPFSTHKIAQRAALMALGVHTTLAAAIWSEEQCREKHKKGYHGNGHYLQCLMDESMALIESAQ